MSEEPPRRRRLAALTGIPEGGLAVAYRPVPSTQTVILVRTAGGVRGWRNRCRHLTVPPDHDDAGRFSTGDGRFLVCGKHGALYRPDDGGCVAGPCVGAALGALPVVVDGDAVYLDLESVPVPLSGFRRDP